MSFRIMPGQPGAGPGPRSAVERRDLERQGQVKPDGGLPAGRAGDDAAGPSSVDVTPRDPARGTDRSDGTPEQGTVAADQSPLRDAERAQTRSGEIHRLVRAQPAEALRAHARLVPSTVLNLLD